jgi:hypothetical protein
MPNPQVQQPPTVAETCQRQLHIGVVFSQIMARGRLVDLTIRSTPSVALPYVQRILADSKILLQTVDVNELETHLYFWYVDVRKVRSLERDWVVLLSLVPHWLELIPGDVARAFGLEMAEEEARVGREI